MDAVAAFTQQQPGAQPVQRPRLAALDRWLGFLTEVPAALLVVAEIILLLAGVIARYVLGDPMAPWFGGSASLTSAFIKKNPAEAKKFIAAYAKGVAYVRSKPDEARQYMKGYTAIEGPLTGEVPLAAYMMYDEFKPADIAHFQKFFDLFSEKGIFSSRLMVGSMLYKG